MFRWRRREAHVGRRRRAAQHAHPVQIRARARKGGHGAGPARNGGREREMHRIVAVHVRAFQHLGCAGGEVDALLLLATAPAEEEDEQPEAAENEQCDRHTDRGCCAGRVVRGTGERWRGGVLARVGGRGGRRLAGSVVVAVERRGRPVPGVPAPAPTPVAIPTGLRIRLPTDVIDASRRRRRVSCAVVIGRRRGSRLCTRCIGIRRRRAATSTAVTVTVRRRVRHGHRRDGRRRARRPVRVRHRLGRGDSQTG